MAMQRNVIIELFWKIHPKLYRLSNGRIGRKMMGLPVLLLTARGRKSGLLRTKALMYMPYEQNFVVIGSNLGSDRHPIWWLNLQAEPIATVQVGAKEYQVFAREAQGEEREKLWQMVAEKSPAYNDYKTMTKRKIPVVVLDKQ